MVTVEMCRGIDQPCAVQDNDVSQSTCHPVAIPEVITPQHADESREDEAHEEREPWVKSLLESNGHIFSKVIEVQFLACLNDVFVLLQK